MDGHRQTNLLNQLGRHEGRVEAKEAQPCEDGKDVRVGPGAAAAAVAAALLAAAAAAVGRQGEETAGCVCYVYRR